MAAAGINPYQHYILFGWVEGPLGVADTSAYLGANADVAAGGTDLGLGGLDLTDLSAAIGEPDPSAYGLRRPWHFLQTSYRRHKRRHLPLPGRHLA